MKHLKTGFDFIAYADSRQGGRAENQDTCAWGDTPYGFLVTVCDGMGGGPSGKLASMIAADSILQYLKNCEDSEADRKSLLAAAIMFANEAVFKESLSSPSKKGMGTTVTALLINDESAVIAHVGDSRVYQFRRGRKHFRTDDHSLVFEQVKSGELKNEEEARLSPESNIILRALGISKDPQPEVVERAYEKGDRIMLCSDGIWGMFPEKKLISIAAGTPSLQGAVESLVVQVDEEGNVNGGGHDNLTVAMIETTKNSLIKEKMSTKQIRLVSLLGLVCVLSLAFNVLLLTKYIPEHKKGSIDENQRDSLIEKIVEEKLALRDKKYNDLVEQLSSRVASGEETKDLLDEAKKEISLRDEIDGMIKDIQSIQNKKSGAEMDSAVARLVLRFNLFEEKAGADFAKEDMAKIKEWLGNSIMKQDGDKAVGHRALLIKRLKKIKEAL